MPGIIYSKSAGKYFRKIQDKHLKEKFREAIKEILADYTVGERKTGDLAGIYRYDVYYNGINYEIAYRLIKQDDETFIIIIMAGTRENFWREIKKYIK
jgi:mRNA interferase RelE/StbE